MSVEPRYSRAENLPVTFSDGIRQVSTLEGFTLGKSTKPTPIEGRRNGNSKHTQGKLSK